MALPRDVTPMLATAGKLPESDDGWAYEIKFDGVRVLAFVENGTARLVTRNGSLWACVAADGTNDLPGKSVGWQMCVKEGSAK